jgi:hypothetical protein
MMKEFGMKRFVNRMVIILMVGAVASVLAFGKTTKKDVTFNRAVTVNGTIIKPGTYSVAFDDETSELTINKGSKVVAKTQARLEKLEGRAQVEYQTRAVGDGPTETPVLVSVTLKDRNQATIVNGGDNNKGESAQ